MGDRALVQMVIGKEFSPVVYLHWHGSDVPKFLSEAEERMKGRSGDLPYAFARFVGVCNGSIDGNLSLGVWNAKSVLKKADTHGDNGCFIVDISGEKWMVRNTDCPGVGQVPISEMDRVSVG